MVKADSTETVQIFIMRELYDILKKMRWNKNKWTFCINKRGKDRIYLLSCFNFCF
ncbi:unnamed protein product [Nezara viridula]|uniref:Uncharacterized protein n=1 Tax=Nezara viridula TaxID=85310 RepID=A0A9P0H0G2_NEZVI|nr:unnamed protein product [Nezara viridula]